MLTSKIIIVTASALAIGALFAMNNKNSPCALCPAQPDGGMVIDDGCICSTERDVQCNGNVLHQLCKCPAGSVPLRFNAEGFWSPRCV